MSQQSISNKDLMFLIISFLIGTAIMQITPALVKEARQDAWLSLLISMILSIVLAKLLISLQRLFPNQSLIQYSVNILGYPIGKAISGIFLWFAFFLSALILRNIGDFVQALILPHTPLVIIHTIIMIIIAYAIRSGLEVFTRVIIIILPLSILFFLIISTLNLPQLEINRIVPFMENGYKPLIRGAIVGVSFPFGEILIFSMILFQTNHSKQYDKFIIYGIIFAYIFLVLSILRTISALGVESTIRYIYPIIETVQESSSILTILVTLNWFAFAFSKLSICFYALTSGLAQWFNIKYYQAIVTPMGVIIIAFSTFMYSNYTEEVYYAYKINPYFKIPIEFGIPFLLWLVAKIRFKKL
ncbi:spore germination protein [Desulfofarcimen acetoxidans DSM 771]|uniref:Spore germination protein n=1 Tax=Desulfofarcimen acetoxidans (strain ATCC 49208 / DSM 771 / KCTC 5769 / VKM B-1644 / 5575) TaxID=485916 RepID=C8W0V4_DESAS|nr:endospore germination permease [Desulfofarcimen acetoxidans]ACV63359.1 spore germination protein [Desulfofarcimen acetoxidans DSM 771]